MDSLADQYGHDDSLFLSDIPEYLRCIVCSLVLRDPVQILSCGHKYCQVCFSRWKTQAQRTGVDMLCPIDREVLDTGGVHPDVAMKRVIGNLQIRCREHENGCIGTGDLRHLEVHHSKCKHRKPDTRLTADNLLIKLSERLEQCESSLFDKDKEIALLKYKLQEQEQQHQEQQQLQQEQMQKKDKQQEQLNEDVALLKYNIQLLEQRQQEQMQQQQEQQKEKNEMLEEEISQLKKENRKQQQKNEMLEKEMVKQKSQIDELVVNVGTSQEKVQSPDQAKVNSKGACTTTVDIHQNISNTSKKKVAVQKIPVKHHSGEREDVTVTDDFHRVVFSFWSTVSAPTAVVPWGTRVWYEVYFLPDGEPYQQIGWATANLPISVEYRDEGVGDEKDSYGFNPFSGDKWHGGSTKWGKTLQQKEGGYVGVAVDTVKGEILFSVNGDWNTTMGVAFSGVHPNTQLFPALSGQHITMEVNFGDRAFKYGPPSSNFKSLMDSL